jgi:hypothetical protein
MNLDAIQLPDALGIHGLRFQGGEDGDNLQETACHERSKVESLLDQKPALWGGFLILVVFMAFVGLS